MERRRIWIRRKLKRWEWKGGGYGLGGNDKGGKRKGGNGGTHSEYRERVDNRRDERGERGREQ